MRRSKSKNARVVQEWAAFWGRENQKADHSSKKECSLILTCPICTPFAHQGYVPTISATCQADFRTSQSMIRWPSHVDASTVFVLKIQELPDTKFSSLPLHLIWQLTFETKKIQTKVGVVDNGVVLFINSSDSYLPDVRHGPMVVYVFQVNVISIYQWFFLICHQLCSSEWKPHQPCSLSARVEQRPLSRGKGHNTWVRNEPYFKLLGI